MGSLFWAAHVLKRPLCAYPCAIDLLIATARFAETERDWEARVDLSQEQMTELQHIRKELLDNEWIQWVPTNVSEKETCDVWCDASDHAGAYMIIYGNVLIETQQLCFDPRTHIFLKELYTGVQGILRAHQQFKFKKIRVHIDNAAAHHCIRKRHSTVFPANVILSTLFCKVFPPIVESTLVKTNDQLADPYTRGVPSLRTPCDFKTAVFFHKAWHELNECQTAGCRRECKDIQEAFTERIWDMCLHPSRHAINIYNALCLQKGT